MQFPNNCCCRGDHDRRHLSVGTAGSLVHHAGNKWVPEGTNMTVTYKLRQGCCQGERPFQADAQAHFCLLMHRWCMLLEANCAVHTA